MRPAVKLIKLALLWLVIALFSVIANILQWPFAAELGYVFWGFLMLLMVISLIDYLALRIRPLLTVERSLEPHLALGVKQAVNLRISNQSDHSIQLAVSDSPPAQLQIQGLPVELDIKSGEFADVRYYVTAIRRGPAEFSKVCCRVISRMQLWEKNFYYAQPQQSKVYPNYKPLFSSSVINSEQLYADLGVHLNQRRGEGTDFRQLRDFREGDSLRQIDWRASARFHRPISREYQEEKDQQIIFMLDCGRRMRAREGDISHFDHALNALLLSAFIALRQGDGVGLLSFAGQARWIPPVKGRGQITQLLEQIYDLDSSIETSDFIDVSQQLISRHSKRSLVILISSLEPEDKDDLTQAVRLLSRHHLVIVASMRQQVIRDAQEMEVISLGDALSFCGAVNHQQKQAAMLTELRSDNVIVIDTLPSTMHSALVTEYMALKRSGIF
jgi:uncharacterized protein (DUF58 family)